MTWVDKNSLGPGKSIPFSDQAHFPVSELVYRSPQDTVWWPTIKCLERLRWVGAREWERVEGFICFICQKKDKKRKKIRRKNRISSSSSDPHNDQLDFFYVNRFLRPHTSFIYHISRRSKATKNVNSLRRNIGHLGYRRGVISAISQTDDKYLSSEKKIGWEAEERTCNKYFFVSIFR